MERSEIIEVISEAADLAVRKHADVEGFEVDDLSDKAESKYTEEAQRIFDVYYDEYDEFSEKWLKKYPDTRQEQLLRIILSEAGLIDPPQPIEWGNCAIAFYWEGTEEELEDDIYFEPGHYLWNEHTLLNWQTMAPEFDFVYLMKATDGNFLENGKLRFPELYRMCDKGVVVRRLRREHESGGPRPSFENRDEYVFIVDVPGKVRISGEEFHFIPPKYEWMYLYSKKDSVAYPVIPKIEYDSGSYDPNWLTRLLEDFSDLDFVHNIGGATITPLEKLINER